MGCAGHSMMCANKKTNRLLFFLISFCLWGRLAVAGGSDGGGNPIETMFKLKGLEIARYLSKLSPIAKRSLKFDPDALLKHIEIPGNFVPLCASRASLKEMAAQEFNSANVNLEKYYLNKLKELNKAAIVNSNHPQVVHLLCETGNEAEWRDVFESDDDALTIFIIHELLRVFLNNSHPEDDYSISTSFIEAARIETRVQSPLLQKVLFAKDNEMCRVKTSVRSLPLPVEGGYIATAYLIDFNFLLNGNPVWESRVNNGYTIQNNKYTTENSARSVVLNNPNASRKIIELLKDYNCL
jgi:hypothetical protein